MQQNHKNHIKASRIEDLLYYRRRAIQKTIPDLGFMMGGGCVETIMSTYIIASVQANHLEPCSSDNDFSLVPWTFYKNPVFPHVLLSFCGEVSIQSVAGSDTPLYSGACLKFKQAIDAFKEVNRRGGGGTVLRVGFPVLRNIHFTGFVVEFSGFIQNSDSKYPFKKAKIIFADSLHPQNYSQRYQGEWGHELLNQLKTGFRGQGLKKVAFEFPDVMPQGPNSCGDNTAYNLVSLMVYGETKSYLEEAPDLRGFHKEGDLCPYYPVQLAPQAREVPKPKEKIKIQEFLSEVDEKLNPLMKKISELAKPDEQTGDPNRLLESYQNICSKLESLNSLVIEFRRNWMEFQRRAECLTDLEANFKAPLEKTRYSTFFFDETKNSESEIFKQLLEILDFPIVQSIKDQGQFSSAISLLEKISNAIFSTQHLFLKKDLTQKITEQITNLKQANQKMLLEAVRETNLKKLKQAQDNAKKFIKDNFSSFSNRLDELEVQIEDGLNNVEALNLSLFQIETEFSEQRECFDVQEVFHAKAIGKIGLENTDITYEKDVLKLTFIVNLSNRIKLIKAKISQLVKEEKGENAPIVVVEKKDFAEKPRLNQNCAENMLEKAAELLGWHIQFDYEVEDDCQVDLGPAFVDIESHFVYSGADREKLKTDLEGILANPDQMFFCRMGTNGGAGHWSLVFYDEQIENWVMYSSPTNCFSLFDKKGKLTERAAGCLITKGKTAKWGTENGAYSIQLTPVDLPLLKRASNFLYDFKTQGEDVAIEKFYQDQEPDFYENLKAQENQEKFLPGDWKPDNAAKLFEKIKLQLEKIEKNPETNLELITLLADLRIETDKYLSKVKEKDAEILYKALSAVYLLIIENNNEPYGAILQEISEKLKDAPWLKIIAYTLVGILALVLLAFAVVVIAALMNPAGVVLGMSAALILSTIGSIFAKLTALIVSAVAAISSFVSTTFIGATALSAVVITAADTTAAGIIAASTAGVGGLLGATGVGFFAKRDIDEKKAMKKFEGILRSIEAEVAAPEEKLNGNQKITESTSNESVVLPDRRVKLCLSL